MSRKPIAAWLHASMCHLYSAPGAQRNDPLLAGVKSPVERGGSLVDSAPLVGRVDGSNSALAAT